MNRIGGVSIFTTYCSVSVSSREFRAGAIESMHGKNRDITPKIGLYAILNSLLASYIFCHLLLIFVKSLDPDQDRQNVGPDLDPNGLTL